MDEVSVEGAFAFGEYFMDLYSYVIATGDTTEWRELSHPECQFCANALTLVASPDFVPGDSVGADLTPITGRQIGPNYFSLDYDMLESWEGVSEPVARLALLGVIREDDHWLMRAVEIQNPDGSSV